MWQPCGRVEPRTRVCVALVDMGRASHMKTTRRDLLKTSLATILLMRLPV